MSDYMANIRPTITDFFAEYLDISTLIEPRKSNTLHNTDIMACVGKLLISKVFLSVEEIEHELFTEKGVIISLENFL